MPTARRSVDYRIDPFDLYLFVRVVQLGSITAAAAAVNLSLAAASARLKALEDTTGTRLLERARTGATPTDAGRALQRHAGRVLAEIESLHVEMASFGRGLRGTVRLLCNTAALTEALPRTIGGFLARTPDVDVDLEELPSAAIVEALRRDAADLGIVADHVDTSGLVVQAWREDRLVALVPARHGRSLTGLVVGRRRTVCFAELLDHPLVGLPRQSGLSRFLAGQASRSGRLPRHRVRLAGFDAVAEAVAAGAGLAVMPHSAAARHGDARTRVIALSDAWAHRTLLVCMTEARSRSHRVQALVEALLAA